MWPNPPHTRYVCWLQAYNKQSDIKFFVYKALGLSEVKWSGVKWSEVQHSEVNSIVKNTIYNLMQLWSTVQFLCLPLEDSFTLLFNPFNFSLLCITKQKLKITQKLEERNYSRKTAVIFVIMWKYFHHIQKIQVD